MIDSGDACDDGALLDGDGCSGACIVESHWQCTEQPSRCECSGFFRGADCATCAVLVDLEPSLATRDGLSWSTAFATVQEGIDAAAMVGVPCEVWVAQGVYRIFESDSTDTLLLRSGVGVYGGFAGFEVDRDARDVVTHPVVLHGATASDPAVRVARVVSAIGTVDATLDGFSVTSGEATAAYEDAIGVWVEDAAGVPSRVALMGCTITGHYSSLRGSALTVRRSTARMLGSSVTSNYCSSSSASVLVEHATMIIEASTFSGNRCGGVQSYQSSIRISDSIIDGASSSRSVGMMVTGSTFEVVRTVFLRNGGGSGTVASGFTARNSQGTIQGSTFQENRGRGAPGFGGALLADSVVEVQDSVFDRNVNLFSSGVGGLGIMGDSGTTVLTRCTFVDNGAGYPPYYGALYVASATAVISESTFLRNDGSVTGAVGCADATCILNGCRIEGNRGSYAAGVYASGGSLRVEQTHFLDNVSSGGLGAIYLTEGDAHVSRSWFSGNSGWVGVAQVRDSEADLENCAVWDNVQTGPAPHFSVWGSGSRLRMVGTTIVGPGSWVPEDGLVYAGSGGSAELLGCIVWPPSNPLAAALLQADATSQIQAAYSLIPGGFSGPENLDASPLFVDLLGGDLHLQSISPGVDAVLDASTTESDLEGTPRIDLPGIGVPGYSADMGAFECHP